MESKGYSVGTKVIFSGKNVHYFYKLLKTQNLDWNILKFKNHTLSLGRIDPVGNTGKSSFARAYVSVAPTEGILMKIDNLDRMELTVIKKIENYRMKYYKDPKVLLFDFPRVSDMRKILSATA